MESNFENSNYDTLDNLPLPYLIFGKKKEHNPMEEFWMNKLEAIESQYDKHMIRLERNLLDNRVNKRRLIKKDEHITKLATDLEEKTDKLSKLSTLKSQLKQELSLKTYKTSRLSEKLANTEEVKKKIQQSLESERLKRMKTEKELASLKHKLNNLERDKRFLFNDIVLKEGERQRVEDQNAQLAQNKFNLIKNLTDIDQERRIQAEVNMKLVEDVGNLLQGCKTQEYSLLKQRKEIDLMLETMKYKRKDQEETMRKLGFYQKHLQDANEDKKVSNEMMEHLERQIKHWKEDTQLKENDNKSKGLEIKDLQRENSQLRCQLAELRAKLNRNDALMKSLELEKKRTDIELEKFKGQAQSVHKVMSKNELVKQKLAEKILKKHPEILQKLKVKDHEQLIHGKRIDMLGRSQNKKQNKEIISYRKKISELERQKRDQECQINELRKRQNRLQFQLKKYDGMEKEILWTEKAMVKLEGDRNRLEDLMKSMALNDRVPFEKLVTDPSILDSISRQHVLQKRLMQQSEKVEVLKKSAIKIVEYRKLKQEDVYTDKRREIPPWKLSHWNKQSSEDTLADVDQQMLDNEGPLIAPSTLQDRKYYTEYMSYLDNEIPNIKKQIAVIERKQQYNQQQLLDSETKKKIEMHKGHFEDETGLEELPKKGAKEEEEAEDEEVDGEGEEDESDIEGLLAVVSIDEADDELLTPTHALVTDKVDEKEQASDNQEVVFSNVISENDKGEDVDTDASNEVSEDDNDNV